MTGTAVPLICAKCGGSIEQSAFGNAIFTVVGAKAFHVGCAPENPAITIAPAMTQPDEERLAEIRASVVRLRDPNPPPARETEWTQKIELDRAAAREAWQNYRKHVQYSTPIDQEIMRTYHAIARGRVVIRALASIAAAGLDDNGLPRLAIVRADATRCFCTIDRDGGALFSDIERWRHSHWTRHQVRMAPGSFPTASVKTRWGAAQAIVPIIPLHLRPKRGLANYHILWEAEWERIVPRDPFLLRRVGKGDLWVVLAQWDLTEVERAALAAHTVR